MRVAGGSLKTPQAAEDAVRQLLRDAGVDVTTLAAENAARAAVNAVKELAQAQKDTANAAFLATAATFGAHLVPLYSATENGLQGEYREAGFSLIGDVSMFVGVGFLTKGGQAVAASYRAAWVLIVTTAAADAGVAGYRTYEGINALRNGDDLAAAAKFGEAALRLVGITPSAAAYLKAAGRAKVVTAELAARDLLIKELIVAGKNVTANEVLFIAKRSDGVIVWLEKGVTDAEAQALGRKAGAGLAHILEVHGADFVNRGIPKDQVGETVMRAVMSGRPIGLQGSRTVYELEVNGVKQYVSVTVSNNGFIVGANPTPSNLIQELLRGGQ